MVSEKAISRGILVLSILWFFIRLAVVIITPIALRYECYESLRTFLWMLFISTVISLGLQVLFLIYGSLVFCYKLNKERMLLLPGIIYCVIEYLLYGMFRLAMFVAGAVWVSYEEECDDFPYIYSVLVVVGYFVTLWSMCWIVWIVLFIAWWNAQTL